MGLYATWTFLWVLKIIEWLLWSNRFEQRKQTSSGSQRLLGFWRGGRRQGTKSIRARVCARENPMKPFVRTSFLGTRPSCLPSPGGTVFLHRRPKNRIYKWEALKRGSPVIKLKAKERRIHGRRIHQNIVGIFRWYSMSQGVQNSFSVPLDQCGFDG